MDTDRHECSQGAQVAWSRRGEVENRHCAREWRGYGARMLSILELPTVRQRVARISVESYHAMSAQGLLDERTELLRGVYLAFDGVHQRQLRRGAKGAACRALLAHAHQHGGVRRHGARTRKHVR